MTDFLVEHQCPQCGAPILLEESDRLVACRFCRVKSYLIQKKYFRYLFSHNAPETEEIIYVPYWRFKGSLFSSTPGGVKHRFLDFSYLAVKSDFFPITLGFRSQALKLRFATPKTPGRFFESMLSLEDAMGIFGRRSAENPSQTVFFREYIGETLSVVYSPFYVKGRIMDAILNKPASGISSDGFDPDRYSMDAPDWPLVFVPTLCPDCGWDLEGDRDSLALLCRNCESVWFPKGKGLEKIGFATLAGSGNLYLPFWRIKAAVGGIALSNYADLVRLANLPVAPRPDHAETEFHFWSAAFKVPPKTFLRLNGNLTIAQPKRELARELPSKAAYPANLSISEAVESLKINLAEFARPRQRMLPLLSSITIKATGAILVYVPFEEGHHEYVNKDFALTINRNQLRLASNL